MRKAQLQHIWLEGTEDRLGLLENLNIKEGAAHSLGEETALASHRRKVKKGHRDSQAHAGHQGRASRKRNCETVIVGSSHKLFSHWIYR